ncbi:MAG: hypothetical protein A2Z16_03240 [Chloroflexi bacterium RBG_16_54_18]|nr:MAG: hypothetical protein A2Z16_03240 [Chloroflexi bacterium RBG_16_54_18]
MDNPSETQALPPAPRRRPRHTLTHLIVGGIAFSLDALSQRLGEWEAQSEQQVLQNQQVEYPDVISSSRSQFVLPEPVEDTADTARYALVGLLFNAQDRFTAGLDRAGRLTGNVFRYTTEFSKPITGSRFFLPLASGWDSLVSRGEAQFSTWVDRGRVEEGKGVSIARQAVQGTTDEVIEVLAVHPGVKELVEKQGTGFATEIVEEIRERTVSLDTLVERVIHKVLKKKPRTQFLPAAEEVPSTAPGVTSRQPVERQ